ncbi:MAG: hypothetical protein ACK5RO_07575 [Pseudobdellovibrionaceae bacterium]|jgi:hypothetical protein
MNHLKNILFSICSLTLCSEVLYAQHQPLPITREMCRGGLSQLDPSITPERAREIERRCAEAAQASARIEVRASGVDSWDCERQALARARSAEFRLVRDCERRAEGLHRCEVVRHRMIDYGSPIYDVVGIGRYDERKSNEGTCRTTAAHRAEREALRNCQEELGVNCLISRSGQTTDYRVERRRRYVIMGPKEDFHVCRADASALPPAHIRVKCSLELEARTTRF